MLAGCRSGPEPMRSAQILQDEVLTIAVVEHADGSRTVEFRGRRIFVV